MAQTKRNTRDEIVAVSMRKFIDQGYDKTSLREIADEIGVTKAALYYHFRTKDDIVTAAMDAHAARVNDLIEWLEGTEPSIDRNEQLIDRLIDLFSGDSGLVMRFGQANPTSMSSKDFGRRHVGQIMRLMQQLAGPEPDAAQSIRATLGFGALVMGTMPSELPVAVGTPDERRAAGRALALELLAPLVKQD
ncbi:TetR/AcrR family transcriptional regulator [Nakamurella lactea]|uniref:TetR/AcrR family transcriptional regulator n=1 Tax=Nakamurella lactea TaxID=459515 RepID=UPI0003FD6334|nr:TetR/AcrR family transcriptional regulator [Nakamurella lactea]